MGIGKAAVRLLQCDQHPAIADSVALASDHARVPDFDVVVRAGEGIPDWGVGGAAPAPGGRLT